EYTADQKKIKAPLYLVRVDLKAGDILGILADQKDPYAPMKIGPYLDFEFLGKCGELAVQNDHRRKPLATSTSAVHVFGVTLEKSPVELRLKQAQPGNIFHNDETPEASFALLGKDTRTAGYESPFGTWWFSGVHNTTKDPAVAGPMLFKAGFRRTTMSWTKASEQDFAPWKLSLNQIQWPFRLADLKDWPAAEKRAELVIRALLKRFPHCLSI